MVWLGLALGIIDIWKADKLFFQFFENIFERAMGSVCPSMVRVTGFRSSCPAKNEKIVKPFSAHHAAGRWRRQVSRIG